MKLRKAIFWIHLGAGCCAGAVIFFLALTGSIMTYERQIVAWQERGYCSQPPSATAAEVPVDRLLSTAALAMGEQPYAILLRADRRDPVEVDFGRDKRLFLNRYTGAVLGPGAVRTRAFFRAVEGLHRWFGAASSHKAVARTIQGSFALVLLLMIVTGLVLWWPRAWSMARFKSGLLLRFSLAGRARDWNRHLVLGAWAALPLTVIVVTGVIIGFSWATNLLYRVAGSPIPAPAHVQKQEGRQKKSHPVHPGETGTLSFNQIFVSAEQQAVGWHSLQAILPGPTKHQMTVTVDFSNGTRPDQKAELVFDRRTGELVKMQTFSSYTLGKRLRLFAHMVHTGEAGGVLGQTISGLSSLCCCVLVLTGFQLVFRRVQLKRTSRKLALQKINASPELERFLGKPEAVPD